MIVIQHIVNKQYCQHDVNMIVYVWSHIVFIVVYIDLKFIIRFFTICCNKRHLRPPRLCHCYLRVSDRPSNCHVRSQLLETVAEISTSAPYTDHEYEKETEYHSNDFNIWEIRILKYKLIYNTYRTLVKINTVNFI